MSDEGRSSPGVIVARWARALHPDPDGGRKGDVAARARLRRVTTPVEALADPAGIDLVRRLCEPRETHFARKLVGEFKGAGSGRIDARALIAVGTLAAVLATAARPREAKDPFAAVLGHPAAGDAPLYPAIRFTGLLNAEPGEAQLRALRRAVVRLRAAERPFNTIRFAEDVLDWDEHIRVAWTFQYHQEALATPASADRDEIV